MMAAQDGSQPSIMSRLPFFGKRKAKDTNVSTRESDGEDERTAQHPPKWSFGVLNDKDTIEVPGKTSHLVRPWPSLTCNRFCFIACGPQE